MRKMYLFSVVVFITTMVFGQAPNSFNFQAIVRNSSGAVRANEHVTFEISILHEGVSGATVYSETDTLTTSELGLATIEIGKEHMEVFPSINWANGPYFLKISVDGTEMGTTQLLSVPYAKFAENAGSVNYDNLTNKPTIPTNLNQLTPDAGNRTIINLKKPVNTTDAASKAYVDSVASNSTVHLNQSSTNYYGSGYLFLSVTDTAYKSIPGLNPSINVPSNCTVLLSSTGSVYGTCFNTWSQVKIALLIDGNVPAQGGVQSLRIVTDDTKSSGSANWTINYPLQLSPGIHTIEVKAKSLGLQNECSLTIDNGGFFDNSTLTVSYLRE